MQIFSKPLRKFDKKYLECFDYFEEMFSQKETDADFCKS